MQGPDYSVPRLLTASVASKRCKEVGALAAAVAPATLAVPAVAVVNSGGGGGAPSPTRAGIGSAGGRTAAGGARGPPSSGIVRGPSHTSFNGAPIFGNSGGGDGSGGGSGSRSRTACVSRGAPEHESDIENMSRELTIAGMVLLPQDSVASNDCLHDM
eukprot:352327-Chlamydomonas_euryale.AAC.2